jgi:hypothetical protein
MAKKFEKKLLSSAMALAMAAGLGFSGSASAIHESVEGVGQLLLAPYYTTLNGYSTSVAIYNTREDVAVKVKVVIRSMGHSVEGRDFICYLTPADVCRFELVNDGGQAYVTSTDDSVRNTSGGFASQSPLKIIVDDTNMLKVDRSDINEFGHMEFIGAYAVRLGTYNTNDGQVVVKREMSKVDLAKIFDYDRGLTTPVSVGGAVVSTDPTLTRISGDVKISSSADRMGYRIPALDGLGDVLPVIANADFDVNVRDETPIGRRFGVAGGDHSYAIEDSIATTRVTGVYDYVAGEGDKTAVIVTFPTKYLHRGVSVCGDVVTSPVGYTHPFDANGTVPFGLVSYDNEERKRQETVFFSPSTQAVFPAEVNYLVPNWFAIGGYYDINIQRTDACAYAGLPAFAFTHKYRTGADGSVSSSILVPSAHH